MQSIHSIDRGSNPVRTDGDTARGWDLSAENSGKEWIEIRFASSIYVNAFKLYETYKPGAVYELSSAVEYTDNNTEACCGEDARQARVDVCSPLPLCSKATKWKKLWKGTAGNSGDSANIFAPQVCPYAFKTDVIRIDLDTQAASGWNNYDAAELSGTLEFPPGLILPDGTATGAENKVGYVTLPGVHGVDKYSYAVTDCYSYGSPSDVTLTIPAPPGAFKQPPFLTVRAFRTSSADNDPTTAVSAQLNVREYAGFFSLFEVLVAPVTVQFLGASGMLSNVTLSNGATLSPAATNTTIFDSDWKSSQTWIAGGAGVGKAELWFSDAGSLTYRVLVDVSPSNLPECPSGHHLEVQSGIPQCVPCPASTYEREGACMPCPVTTICAVGSTLQSWILKPGMWRISNSTSEIHRCKEDDDDASNCTALLLNQSCPTTTGRSPCVGGSVAGHYGEDYCAAGFRGPMYVHCF